MKNGRRERLANPVTVSALIGTTVKQLGVDTEIKFEKIKKNWQLIVGQGNARQTRPVSIKGDVLTVAVSSPAWLVQTRFYKADFVSKINNYEKQDQAIVRDINFILDSCDRSINE
jgi:predicted nucleic acid-binding Zn ribbon protein